MTLLEITLQDAYSNLTSDEYKNKKDLDGFRFPKRILTLRCMADFALSKQILLQSEYDVIVNTIQIRNELIYLDSNISPKKATKIVKSIMEIIEKLRTNRNELM